MNPNIKFSLTAIEAKELISADSNGLSDPYFKIPHKQRGVVDLPKKTNRTKTVMKTLNPTWNHTFEVEFNPQACNKLDIAVYDYDYIGKDDLLGTGEINLQWMITGGQDTFEEWIPLKVTTKDKKTKLQQTIQKGSVHVKLQVKSRPGQPPNYAQHPMGQMPNQPPMGQIPNQPPMGQIPNHPPMGQIPNQPPMGQMPNQPPIGQIPNQPPIGKPPQALEPPKVVPPPAGQSTPFQFPHLKPIGSQSTNPPLKSGPPSVQPPKQPSTSYSSGQSNQTQKPNQPPTTQPPANYPSNQPPANYPSNQPPANYPSNQPPANYPPTQPPANYPPTQPPANYPSNQPPANYPSNQPPANYPPNQPPANYPPNQPYTQPPPSYPPAQHSMVQPPYGPHAPPAYPPQYSQPPLAHAGTRPMTAPLMPVPVTGPHMMPPPMMGPNMAVPMMGPHMMQPAGMVPPGVNILHNFRRGDALQPGSWIPVNEPDVMVGLGWDFTGGEAFDLDASVTGFDAMLNVVDSIYFNHKRGLSGSVIHFGDNTTGVGQGDDEVIQVILNRVPMNVRYLAVTINSFKKNSLIRARSAYIRLYTRTYHIGKYLLQRTKDCIGLLLGVFERSQDPYMWYFRVMADPIKGNKVTLSYNDIKTLLGAYSMYNMTAQRRIVHPLPGEPLIEFNKWIKLDNRFFYVGLGWNIQQGMNYDLDASILTFDRMNNLMEIIYHKNMRSYDGSILHYGDNRTGKGEGDDEVLSIDFGALNPNTFTMAVVVNSFKGNSMINVFDAFIRIYDQQKFIGVNVLKKCPDCIGLCLGIFRKDMNNGVWSFCAIKEIVRGIVCTESVPDVGLLLGKYPLK